MKNFGIYSRIFSTLIITGVIFIILLFTLYVFKNKQEKIMIDESQTQFNNEVNSLITLKTANLKQVAYDYTFWDDFVKKIKQNDSVWYNNNITTIIKSFHIDYVCVYDTSFKIVHEASSDEFISRNFIPKKVLSKLRDTRFLNFFLLTKEGVFEISGASIHNENDPSHMLTKPQGYLFLVKSWNQDFIKELSILSASKISLLMLTDTVKNNNKYSSSYMQKLPGWDDKPVAKIIFTRTSNSFKLYHNMSAFMFLILLCSIITTWLIFHFTTRKLINKPLKLVTSILKTENTIQINELQQCQGEFKLIGNLFSDFMHQKQALIIAKEKAEESDLLKTAFLNNISHEIRTPFNSILGFLSIIQEDDNLTNDERNEFVTIINNSADRLLNTINDIVEVSQIQTGQMKLKFTETDINKLTAYQFDHFKTSAECKGLKFILKNTLPHTNYNIKTDASKLNAILSNLIDNAIKFTKAGSVEFGCYVETNHALSVIDKIIFYVKDTGIGIPENKRQSIFERFMQADVSNTRKFEGSGLGLSIAKAYVEMLGGKIWVESQEKKLSDGKEGGSTFSFTIPSISNENKIL